MVVVGSIAASNKEGTYKKEVIVVVGSIAASNKVVW